MNRSLKIFIITVFVLLTVFNVYNFFARTVNGDEAILAEQAKELVINGYVRSPMFAGMGEGWENSQLHYHKLFIWIGAVIYKLFDTSLYSMRFISLLSFLLLNFITYKILKNETESSFKFLIFYILFLSNYVVFSHGLIYRPEMLVSWLGLSSFYFIKQAQNDNSLKLVLFSSLFAGFAALSHLNGLSIIFANVFFLLWHKKLKYAILSGATSCMIFLFYFIDINTKAKLIQFKTQFFSDPNFEEGTLTIFSPFIKILNEQMRFFHDIYAISFSILFFFTLIFSFKYLKSFYKSILIYFLLLVIGLAAISHGTTIKYAILYYPFMSLIIVYGLFNSIKKNTRFLKLHVALIGLYLTINIAYSINNVVNFKNGIKRSESISKNMPITQSCILAPEYFYFNQEKNYKIRIPLAYTIRNNDYKRGQWTSIDFYNYNHNLNNYYILLDSCFTNRQILECSNYYSLRKEDTIFNYKVIYVHKDYKLLESLK